MLTKFHPPLTIKPPPSSISPRSFHSSASLHKKENYSIKIARRNLFVEPKLREGDKYLPHRRPVLDLQAPVKAKKQKQGESSKKELPAAVTNMATKSWAHVAAGGAQAKEDSKTAQSSNQISYRPMARTNPTAKTSPPQNPHQRPHSNPSPHGAYTAAEYQRPADQTPNTANQAHESHYIVTLATDYPLHQEMTRLRTIYFPERINRLAAHIAMFRALPGSQMRVLEATLESVSSNTIPFGITAAEHPFGMGKGVGIQVDEGKDAAKLVYMRCKSEWNDFLSKQDKEFMPHWTVQNKENDRSLVDKCMREVDVELSKRFKGQALGLSLWMYTKGYWKFVRKYPFRGVGVEELREGN